MATTEQELHEGFLSSSKGKKLYTRYWYQDDDATKPNPKALLLILHGLCEHSLCYTEMAEFLNKHGIYVFAHDHVGHGQSEGSRVHIDHFQEYVDDSFLHAEKIRKEFPETPLFVLGHSMGGLISIVAANQRPELFKGVILDGPLITLDNLPPGFVIWLGRMVSKIIPEMPSRKLDPKAVSRDPEVVKRYEDDPLVYHGKLKCRQVATVLDTIEIVGNSLSDIEWPFLILHGEPDTLTSVEGSKMMYEKAKSKDKQLKLFPDAYHQLHSELEPVKSETLNLIASWITERA